MKKHLLWLCILIGLTVSSPLMGWENLIRLDLSFDDKNGVALEGPYDVVLRFRNGVDELIWMETQEDIEFVNGIAMLVLGSQSSIDDDILDEDELFLNVRVDGQEKDIEFASVPRSLRTLKSEQAEQLDHEILTYDLENNRIGILQENPEVALDLGGAIIIGDSDVSEEGVWRFRDDMFETYSGEAWEELSLEMHSDLLSKWDYVDEEPGDIVNEEDVYVAIGTDVPYYSLHVTSGDVNISEHLRVMEDTAIYGDLLVGDSGYGITSDGVLHSKFLYVKGSFAFTANQWSEDGNLKFAGFLQGNGRGLTGEIDNFASSSFIRDAFEDDIVITGNYLANDSVVSVDIRLGTVELEDVALGSIESRHIGAGEILSSHIVDGAITIEKFDSDFTDDVEVNISSLDPSLITTGAITTDILAADSVGRYKIADAAIQSSHLDTFTFSRSHILSNEVKAADIQSESIVIDDLNTTWPVAGGGTGQSSANGGHILIGFDDEENDPYFSTSADLAWDDSNKRLGIGVNSPSEAIHIESESTVTAGILIQGTNSALLSLARSQSVSQSVGVNSLGDFVMGDNALYIREDNKVGMGTTSPEAAFDIGAGVSLGDISGGVLSTYSPIPVLYNDGGELTACDSSGCNQISQLFNGEQSLDQYYAEGDGNLIFSGQDHRVVGMANGVGAGSKHRVEGSFSVALSGSNNQVRGPFNAILNGHDLAVNGAYSLIGSGHSMGIDGAFSAIGTGYRNQIEGDYSSILSARDTVVDGDRSTVLLADSARVSGNDLSVGFAKDVQAAGDRQFLGFGENVDLDGQDILLGMGIDIALKGDDQMVLSGSNIQSTGVGSSLISGQSVVLAGKNLAMLAGSQVQISGAQSFLGQGADTRLSGKDIQVLHSSSSNIDGQAHMIGTVDTSSITGHGQDILNASQLQISGAENLVLSGDSHQVAGDENTIVHGQSNKVEGQGNLVLGSRNTVSGTNSLLLSGTDSTLSGDYSGILGGHENTIIGDESLILGGENNQVLADQSVAAGRYAHVKHSGSFVWSDAAHDTPIESSADNQFMVRASGGIRFVTGDDMGVELESGAWANLSDRHLKTDLVAVNTEEILDKVLAMPIQYWSYKGELKPATHIGPFSQDFYKAFGLGQSETHIDSIDADGVAIAAIQALLSRYETQKELGRELNSQMNQLKQDIESFKTELVQGGKVAGIKPMSLSQTLKEIVGEWMGIIVTFFLAITLAYGLMTAYERRRRS